MEITIKRYSRKMTYEDAATHAKNAKLTFLGFCRGSV